MNTDEWVNNQPKKPLPKVVERKVIQISNSDNRVFALCDDGTVWEYGHYGEWGKVPSIPQREYKI